MQWNAPLCAPLSFFYFILRNRLCIGKMTPSLTLLAKCANLETTHWLTLQDWKRTQCTTFLWPLSIRLAPGHSRCPSTPPQRNHVSPSQRGIEIISKWSSFMNRVSLKWRCAIMIGVAFLRFCFVVLKDLIWQERFPFVLEKKEEKKINQWVEGKVVMNKYTIDCICSTN